MKTSNAKKKTAKSLEAVLASVETGMAEVVAAIAAEHKLELASRRRRQARQHRHDAAHAA